METVVPAHLAIFRNPVLAIVQQTKVLQFCASLITEYAVSYGLRMRKNFFHAPTDDWCFLDALDSYFVYRDDDVAMLLPRTEIASASFRSPHFGMTIRQFLDSGECPYKLRPLYDSQSLPSLSPFPFACAACSRPAEIEILAAEFLCLCRQCYLNPNAWFWLGSTRLCKVPEFETIVQKLRKYDAFLENSMLGCLAAWDHSRAQEWCTCGHKQTHTDL